MYQKFDPALLSLMAVAKKVTPQGQPTVAANMLGQAGVPPQAMPPGQPPGQPPGMPPGMPPQGIAQAFPAIPPQGMQGALDQFAAAAPSVAKNMQEQQTAQMLSQGQPQPPMMAEGGIASLPIDDYGYADGGIIGYAAGGEFDLGDSEEARLRDEERVRLIKEQQREEQKRLTAEMLGLPYEPPQQIAAPKRPPETPAVSAPPQQTRPAARPPMAQPESAGIAGVAPRQPMSGAESMYRDQLKAIEEQRKGIQAPRSIDQILQEELAARRARGLAEDPSQLAKQQLSGIEAIDAERQAMMAAQKAPRLQAGMLEGLLAPGAMNLGQLFAGSARGIMKAEEAGRVADIEGLDKKRAVTVANNAIREAIQRAEYAELEGDMATAKAEREKAEAIKQALFTAQQTLTTGRRGEVATEEQQARNRAAQLQIAKIQAEARLNPAATEKQDFAELAKMQAILTSQLDMTANPLMDKTERARKQAMLDQVTARMATITGIGTPSNTMTMADVQATAAKSGKSVEEVVQAAKARGYTIQ